MGDLPYFSSEQGGLHTQASYTYTRGWAYNTYYTDMYTGGWHCSDPLQFQSSYGGAPQNEHNQNRKYSEQLKKSRKATYRLAGAQAPLRGTYALLRIDTIQKKTISKSKRKEGCFGYLQT